MAIAKGPAAHAALRVALKIQLFEAFDTERARAEELAHRCGIDPPLTARIMRELLCIGNSNEDGEEIHAQNIMSNLFDETRSKGNDQGNGRNDKYNAQIDRLPHLTQLSKPE